MKLNRLSVILGILGTILLIQVSALFGQSVRYNFMPGTDFSKYRTYKWVRIESAQYPNQLLDEQIRHAIDTQLRAKGLTQDETAPDLTVVYQVGINKETQYNSYSTGGDYWGRGGWGGWGGGMESTTTTSSTINVGNLDLDFYDTHSKKQIWRGEATKTLDPPKDPAKLQARIDKAMAKLLKNYPPPPKK